MTIQDNDDYGYYQCDCCGEHFNRDEVSLQNEFNVILCDSCLEDLSKPEEKRLDEDSLRDRLNEARELRKGGKT